jgi:hypothetical protein
MAICTRGNVYVPVVEALERKNGDRWMKCTLITFECRHKADGEAASLIRGPERGESMLIELTKTTKN